jgi:hypothetical protein
MRLLSFISICILVPTSVFCQFGNHRQDKKIKSITFDSSDNFSFYVHNQNTTYISTINGSEFTWSEISYDASGKAVKEKITIKQIISDKELNISDPEWSDTGIIESVSYYFHNNVDSCVKLETYYKNQLQSVTFYEYDTVLLVNKASSYSLHDSMFIPISDDSILYKGDAYFMSHKNIFRYDSVGRIIYEENSVTSNWSNFKTYFYENDLLTKIVYDNNRPLSFSSDGWKSHFEDHYTYNNDKELTSIQTYSYDTKMWVTTNEKWTEKRRYENNPIYEYYSDKKSDRIHINVIRD